MKLNFCHVLVATCFNAGLMKLVLVFHVTWIFVLKTKLNNAYKTCKIWFKKLMRKNYGLIENFCRESFTGLLQIGLEKNKFNFAWCASESLFFLTSLIKIV